VSLVVDAQGLPDAKQAYKIPEEFSQVSRGVLFPAMPIDTLHHVQLRSNEENASKIRRRHLLRTITTGLSFLCGAIS
jgi:hypothetical protein